MVMSKKAFSCVFHLRHHHHSILLFKCCLFVGWLGWASLVIISRRTRIVKKDDGMACVYRPFLARPISFHSPSTFSSKKNCVCSIINLHSEQQSQGDVHRFFIAYKFC